ncbi:hypothetical protein Fmac_014314 [Flemingia macrophylla]|uniref:Uncharacterized protein n=1 Tax=Flemingia macrophylla TaxID=520843 RepID=A0ABD1MBC6_9FABA
MLLYTSTQLRAAELSWVVDHCPDQAAKEPLLTRPYKLLVECAVPVLDLPVLQHW